MTGATPAVALPAIRVLVCGSLDRNDDGVAVAAVDEAVARLPAGLRRRLDLRRVVQLDPIDLLDLGPGETCLIVDAVRGPEPGTVVALPLDGLGAGSASPPSSHALSPAAAVALASAVRGAPIPGRFVGLAGSDFGMGQVRSAPVRAGQTELVATIRAELDRLASSPASPASPAPEVP